MHKVGITGIVVLLKIENVGEIVISGKTLIRRTVDRSKFVLEFIWLATVCKLFTQK